MGITVKQHIMGYTIDQITRWMDKFSAPNWLYQHLTEEKLDEANPTDDDEEEEEGDGKPGAAPIAGHHTGSLFPTGLKRFT